ncbi:ATP-binding protein [Nocardioides iriomotensis]|uniref:ATP-binding protein n=2 Tax=Nocardioides iriomotensis TaxID=715784 RepID=A0A4Q5IYW0_9ACTN|nr:ATP-binding protein [Nocardioides iriomotensis]
MAGGMVRERIELGVGLDGPARARRWIEGVCATCDVGDLSDNASLLVSELVTNAVLHARTGCVVMAEIDGDTLRVDVIDGAGDTTAVAPGVERLGADGGRGLVIVDVLSTDWGVAEHAEGKSVWFSLRAEVPSGHSNAPATPTLRLVRS